MELFCCAMLPTKMLSKAASKFRQVRTKLALVHGSNIHVGTDMNLDITSIGSFERAIGTRLDRFPAVIEQMSFKIRFASGAVPTSVTRQTSINSRTRHGFR